MQFHITEMALLLHRSKFQGTLNNKHMQQNVPPPVSTTANQHSRSCSHRIIDCSGNLASPQFPSLQSSQLQPKLRTLSITAKATNKADPTPAIARVESRQFSVDSDK